MQPGPKAIQDDSLGNLFNNSSIHGQAYCDLAEAWIAINI